MGDFLGKAISKLTRIDLKDFEKIGVDFIEK